MDVKTVDAQRPNMIGHLRTYRPRMLGFQAHVEEDVENGFSIFCRKLASSLLDLAAARVRGTAGAVNKSIAPLR